MCDNYDSDNEFYESISSVDEMPKPILERQQPLQEPKSKKKLSEKQIEAFAKGRAKRADNLRKAKQEKLKLENYKKKDTIQEYETNEPIIEESPTLLRKYELKKK